MQPDITPERLAQIEELYHAAREEGRVFSGADEGLRLEVESLLAWEGRALPTLSLDADDSAPPGNLPDESTETAVKPGSVVGCYVIEELVGAGGMGMVFRARDSQLNRPVAVKFLSGELADAAARRRFQREAQLASSLNHPHIVTVHAAGEYESRQYLVTEFVDGGTLKDWAKAEKRSRRQIVELLSGVADALAAAHGAGIMHRDIKPANILVARNGYAKLADFGLARLADTAPAGAAPEGPTQPGIVAGSVAYMSPEQASGGTVDSRSDIFSFGIVLYEMLAGRRPFSAGNDLELLRAIVHGTPGELPRDLSPRLCAIVVKTLEKDPADRYQSARDLVVDLRREARGNPDLFPRKPANSNTWRSRLAWAMLATALAVVLAWIAVFVWAKRPNSQASPVMALNLSLLPPPGVSFVYDRNGEGGFAVSPDGAMLAFVGRTQGKAQLWVRRLGVSESRLVSGSEDAYRPFWSPDSRWVAFFTPLKIKKHDVANGATTDIYDNPASLSGAWSSRNVILLTGGKGPIRRIPDVGGPATVVPGTDGGFEPDFLPDGRRFVYRAAYGSSDLWLASLDSTEKPRRIGEAGTRPTWSAGFLLSVSNGILNARPFDPVRGEFAGPPHPVNAPLAVRVHIGLLLSDFSANAAGMLVYPPRTNSLTELRWRDRAGKLLGTVGAPGQYYTPRISPDGQRVAFSLRDGDGSEIWVANPSGSLLTRLTFEPGLNDHPVWSADSRTITYASDSSGAESLYSKAATGLGNVDKLTTSRVAQQALDWSRDGRFLLFTQISRSSEIMVRPADGSPTLSFLGHASGASKAQFNPGVPRWIAYDFDDSGRREIYVQAFAPGKPASSARWQISSSGGTSPRWRSDGKEIFYLSLDGKLMAARVSGEGSSFQSSTPEVLFDAIAPMMRSPSFEYDVSPDGQRFLMIEPAEKPEYLPLTIVSNWLAK